MAELAVGILIGPFALGGINIPGFGPLFPIPVVDGEPAVIPVSNELFALAQIGSIFLLFAIGLCSDGYAGVRRFDAQCHYIWYDYLGPGHRFQGVWFRHPGVVQRFQPAGWHQSGIRNDAPG
jgi:hypothetical protein